MCSSPKVVSPQRASRFRSRSSLLGIKAHALVLISKAMKILAAKTALNKEWDKFQKTPAWRTPKEKETRRDKRSKN